ncbi:MAG: 4-hydroxy-tetrahydrodipicolinate synthase [Chloroflexota bacterium]
MKKILFRGVATALITPFLPNGEVDCAGLKHNVAFQIENGIQALVPLGTTGETPTLDEKEREAVMRVVVEAVRASRKDIPVIMGAGANSTKKTIENAKQAEAWGADAVLIVTPYYNKPTQAGIVAHFSAVSAAAKIPIIVYNIKSRTGTNIETPTMRKLAQLENIIAVKEASGDIAQMMDVLDQVPDIAVYSGDDAMTLPLIALGGLGIISVVSNLLPSRVVAMTNAALDGDIARARKIHFDLLPLFKGAFIETNPAPIKYAMNQRGLAAGSLRLPLVEMTAENQAKLDAVLTKFR